MEKYCPKCFKRFPQDLSRCPEDDARLILLSDDDLTGTTIDDRYQVLECIGKGGMGVVYRAQQTMIGRTVAMKVLRKDVVQDESAVKRFMTEARAIGNLQSANTVTLLDFGVTREGLIYYTMDFLQGRPFSKIIQDESPVAVPRAVDVILQACDSLEEAHDHGILHRDIKPDNLFITLRRGKEHVVVLDFGIAKLMGDEAGEKITKTGMICGTPAYLSPEQVLTGKAYPASDLYSLAIVLYEAVAGMPPFQDATPIGLLMKHVNERVQPVSVINPKVTVPAGLDEFLSRALAKNHDDRFHSVAAFRDGLTAAVRGLPSQDEAHLPTLETNVSGMRILKQTAPERASKRKPEVEVAEEAVQKETTAEIPERKNPAESTFPSAETDWKLSSPKPQNRFLLPGIAGGVLLLALVGLLIWAPWKGDPQPEPGANTELQQGDSDHRKASGRASKKVEADTADVAEVSAEALSDVVSQPDAGSQADAGKAGDFAVVPDAAAAPDVPAVVEVVSTPEVQAKDIAASPDVTPEVVSHDVVSEVLPDKTDIRAPGDVGATEGTKDVKSSVKGNQKIRNNGRKPNGTDQKTPETKEPEARPEEKAGGKDSTPEVKKPEGGQEDEGVGFRRPGMGFRRPTVEDEEKKPDQK